MDQILKTSWNCSGHYLDQQQQNKNKKKKERKEEEEDEEKELVKWYFEPNRPLGIKSGLKETFIK